jgi:hypothetical protein
MFFLAVLCGIVFEMAQTNVAHYSFLERRGILEQATLSFAESLGKTLKANATAWWAGADTALGNGECVVSPAEAGVPALRFTYVVSPDKNQIYKLFVKGKYDNAAEDVGWGVSIDISVVSSDDVDIWSEITRM